MRTVAAEKNKPAAILVMVKGGEGDVGTEHPGHGSHR